MAEEKTNKLEREYTIPLREVIRSVPSYKKAPKAIREIKKFLLRHMQIRNGNENNIKLGASVNEAIWAHGIKKPVHKIKVKAIKEGDIVTVELVNPSEYFTFNQAKIKRRGDKAKTNEKPKSETKKEEKTDEAKKDIEEKIESTIEAGNKLEKAEAKEHKHETKKETIQGKQRRQGVKEGK